MQNFHIYYHHLDHHLVCGGSFWMHKIMYHKNLHKIYSTINNNSVIIDVHKRRQNTRAPHIQSQVSVMPKPQTANTTDFFFIWKKQFYVMYRKSEIDKNRQFYWTWIYISYFSTGKTNWRKFLVTNTSASFSVCSQLFAYNRKISSTIWILDKKAWI